MQRFIGVIINLYMFNCVREFLVSQLFYDISSYNFSMTIGETIKALRRESGMSQTELAAKLFVSQDTISLWERGKSLPDINALINLTKVFKVSSDYILGLE